jgi:hypothetical protein
MLLIGEATYHLRHVLETWANPPLQDQPEFDLAVWCR